MFGHDAKSTGIPADIFRFYLLFIRPETQVRSANKILHIGLKHFAGYCIYMA